MVTITENVNLSLTERLVPRVIYAKQYDNMTRLIECNIYSGTEQISLDSACTVTVTGTRSDGTNFQYNSDENSDIVYVSDGNVYFWITDTMTATVGRYSIDVTISSSGEVIGTFGLVLRVEKAAVQ